MWLPDKTYYTEDTYSGYTGLIKPEKITRIQINAGVYDYLAVNNSGKDITVDSSEWQNDTVLIALFNGNLKAGQITFDYDTVGQIIVYRKRPNDVKYIPIDIVENTNKSLTEGYTYIDRTVQSHHEYEYAIVFKDTNGAEIGLITALWNGSNKVVFDGYYIYDGETEYHGNINVSLSDTRNVKRNVIEPLYDKYPYVIQTAETNYTTLEIQTQYIEKDNRQISGLDLEYQALFREKVIDFLTNNKAKLFRNNDGRNKIVVLSDSISNTSDGYINAVNTSCSMVEIADAYNPQDLYDHGFTKYNPATNKEDLT